MPNRAIDRHPALAVKDACLARSGVYQYTYDEMVSRGYKPKTYKPLYTEYRPPEVIKRSMDKFGLTAVTVEHTADETDYTNFHKQAAGIVGDKLRIQEMDGGEVGIFGRMAFYTKDAYEAYQSGVRETSADYHSVCKPDPTGKYDFILEDITSVNGVVLTARGRGGPNVRVQDHGVNILGGINKMAGKSGVLGFLGIGRAKDSEFKLSKVVFDGLRELHTLDGAGKEKLVESIMSHITPLTDGSDKDYLLGAVKDSFENPADVMKQEEKVSSAIDTLYARCTDADAKAAEEILKSVKDSFPDKDKDDDGDDDDDDAKKKGEDKKTKDSATMEELFTKFESKITDSIGSLIDKKVSEALGLKPKEAVKEKKTQDSLLDDDLREDASFLLKSAFGD